MGVLPGIQVFLLDPGDASAERLLALEVVCAEPHWVRLLGEAGPHTWGPHRRRRGGGWWPQSGAWGGVWASVLPEAGQGDP